MSPEYEVVLRRAVLYAATAFCGAKLTEIERDLRAVIETAEAAHG